MSDETKIEELSQVLNNLESFLSSQTYRFDEAEKILKIQRFIADVRRSLEAKKTEEVSK